MYKHYNKMKEYTATLDPITKSTIKLRLYTDVKNIPELRKKIVAGELKCCAIKPSLILDPFQIAVAANKAVLAEKRKKLITRTLYSEVLFNLSISKNVTKSLTQFGIDDKYNNIIIGVICKDGEENEGKGVFDTIEGEEQNWEDLEKLTEIDKFKKQYTVDIWEGKYNAHCGLLNTVVNKMVIKEFN